MASKYETLSNDVFDIDELSEGQRRLYDEAKAYFDKAPSWLDFANFWISKVDSTVKGRERSLIVREPIFRILQDLESRLAINQGYARREDYRDRLLDIINENFPSRYVFCREAGIDETFLSHILSKRKHLSMSKLEGLLRRLGYQVELTKDSSNKQTNKVTVIIVDDEVFFRAGVRQALAQQPDFEVLECAFSDRPLEMIEDHLPEVVIVGSPLSAHAGLELGKRISRYFPNTKVIVLTPNPDDEEILDCIKAEAVACLERSATAGEFISIIRQVINGEYPISQNLSESPHVARYVLTQFEDVELTREAISEAVVAPLNKRERQILNYIADGNTNKQIADILGISEQTIKRHVSGILRKMNANERAHAVALALRSGWISFKTGGASAGPKSGPAC